MPDQPEMTELEILIAIHRAIDEAASQSPAARAIAARYVPAYAVPSAAGWTGSLDLALGPPAAAKKAAADLERTARAEAAEAARAEKARATEAARAEKARAAEADKPARGKERA